MGLSIENYVPNSSRAPLKNAVRCAIDGEEVNIFLPANIFASKYFCRSKMLSAAQSMARRWVYDDVTCVFDDVPCVHDDVTYVPWIAQVEGVELSIIKHSMHDDVT
jgi:hypothetical protein